MHGTIDVVPIRETSELFKEEHLK
jgi:hypothetical protein